MTKTLIAHPWEGTLHGELLYWQAHLRYLSSYYERMIIVCEESKKSIYSDFATHIFTPGNIPGIPGADVMVTKDLPIDWENGVPVVRDLRFAKLGGFPEDFSYSLIIDSNIDSHFTEADWDMVTYDADDHLDVGWLSDPGADAIARAGKDLRGSSFDDILSAVTAAKVVVGPSGGVIATAALANVPYVTWVEFGPNKYDADWNPNDTMGVSFTGRPSVRELKDAICFVASSYNSPVD